MFHYRPCFVAAIAFCGGIALGALVVGTWTLPMAAVFLLLALCARLLRQKLWVLPLLFAALGVLRIGLAYPAFPEPENDVNLTGIVCEMPVYQEGQWQAVLKDVRSGDESINGRVLFFLDDPHRRIELAYGQKLSARAAIAPLQTPGVRISFEQIYRFEENIFSLARARKVVLE